MDLGLKDCKAFIAGASKGLGKACAKALADEGARVFICSRNVEELKRAAAEIGAAGYSAADVSRPAEVKRVVAEAIAALGGLDCLVTNAGGPPTAPFEKAGDGDWDIAYQLNLMSAVRLIREALPALKASGRGRIVNLTGYGVKEPMTDLVVSDSVRAGVTVMAKTIASDLAPLRHHRQQYRARSHHDRSPHRDTFRAGEELGHNARRAIQALAAKPFRCAEWDSRTKSAISAPISVRRKPATSPARRSSSMAASTARSKIYADVADRS